MTPRAEPARYQHHRVPGALIRHGVWLYEGEPPPCVSGFTNTSKESQLP